MEENWEDFKEKSSKLHYMEGESSESAEESDDNEHHGEWPIFSIKSNDKKEIKVNVEIENQPFQMELDTGASVSIICENEYNQYLKHYVPLHETSVVLKTYTDGVVPVLGEILVEVKYGKQKVKLPLIIVEGDGPSLFGRNWLAKLKLNWKSIKFTKEADDIVIEELIRKYEVFSDDLGTVKGITAKLKVKTDSTSKFFSNPELYLMH